MFKKALQVATVFGLLLAGYAGYVRTFALLVAWVAPPAQGPLGGFRAEESRRKRDAIALAKKAFGAGHWSTAEDLAIRYYQAEQGYWMYAKSYERPKEQDGKQLKFAPFAMIWQSSDGKSLKAVTSARATVDLDKPLGLLAKLGEDSALHVIHATIEGDVRLRDDKGTPDDPGDDLVVGPLTYVDYDDAALQVKSTSDVVIRDRDLRITGQELLIQLRPKEQSPLAGQPSGFSGAERAYLLRKVHVEVKDVGRSGVLPGTARPDQQAAGGKTPLVLDCQGPMQIDLAAPPRPVRVGPPAPPRDQDTIVQFFRDVVAKRGRVAISETPDQLFCDHLKLFLHPAPKVPPAPGAAAKPAAEPGGPLTELTLRRAEATGHSVWLRSLAQGVRAKGNELIYKKLAPAAPDETYFRADANTKLWIEKVDLVREGPERGKVQGVTHIWTVDATLFDDGQGGDPSTIVARGPGWMEGRPDRDKPVNRSAAWQDQLEVIPTAPDAPGRPGGKQVKLKGSPWFADQPQRTVLKSRDTIVAWLEPDPAPRAQAGAVPAKAPAPAAATTKAAANGSAPDAADSGPLQIRRLQATEDVELTAPSRTMTARDRLDAWFEPSPTTPPAQGRGGAGVAGAAGPPAPAPAVTAQADQAGTPAPPAKPAEPNVMVTANVVWANIRLSPTPEGGTSQGPQPGRAAVAGKGEVREARFRGAVVFHQDPSPGKVRGTDASGEALDVINLGEGKSLLRLYHRDPEPARRRPAIVPASDRGVLRRFSTPAQVVTDEMAIEGEIIGLDQGKDEAWVDSRGSLTQMTDPGLLTDKDPDAEPVPTVAIRPGPDARTPAPAGAARRGAAKAAPRKKTALKINFGSRMRFHGRSPDADGRPIALAEFFGGVRAETDDTDSRLVCRDMKVYLDQPVAFVRPPAAEPRPRAEAAGEGADAEPEPQPQIALIDCVGKVAAVSRKVDRSRTNPRTGRPIETLLQQQIITGEHVIYEKLTGKFYVPGPGEVILCDRDANKGDAGARPSASGIIPTQYTIEPAADPPRGRASDGRAGRPAAVVGRNSSALPAAGAETGRAGTARGQGRGQAQAKRPDGLLPLVETRIKFRKEMLGRFGSGKETDKTETRWADFHGDVEVLRARVVDETTKHFLDFDRPPDDFVSLTAQLVRVVSEPLPEGSASPTRNTLQAWVNAEAHTHDMSIQGDRITYDSQKELFYAYGEDDRRVTFAQHPKNGQPYSSGTGKTFWYNRATGESQIDDPSSVQFIDHNTGTRPKPVWPDNELPAKVPRRKPMRLPPRNNFERNGFSGR